MADVHRSLRLPLWLWQRYAAVVGDVGRSPDLKRYMAWQIDNPRVVLGPDVEPPYDFLATLRVPELLWELFAGDLAEGDVSASLRAYIWWRVQRPDDPLPGGRMPPLRRQSRNPVPV